MWSLESTTEFSSWNAREPNGFLRGDAGTIALQRAVLHSASPFLWTDAYWKESSPQDFGKSQREMFCGNAVLVYLWKWNYRGRKFSWSSHHLTILDAAQVTFGDHVSIGPNCRFHTAGYPQYARGYAFASPITVGNWVWIGSGVTVLPGISIGDGTVVSAGSVVTTPAARCGGGRKSLPGHPFSHGRRTSAVEKLGNKGANMLSFFMHRITLLGYDR